MKYHVSKSGNDLNTGISQSQAFLTINKGISKLKAGDVLIISAGTYVEFIQIRGINTEAGAKITIQAKDKDVVRIEQTLNEFRTTSQLPGDSAPVQWLKAKDIDASAHADEYISASLIPDITPDGIKGAFLDLTTMPYTRLITYSNINDFRSANEKFGKIFNPANKSGLAEVTTESGEPVGHYFPFFYMGPGIWLNRDTRKLHIRLSHTHNNIAGLKDYAGEINPNKVKLAISLKSMESFIIGNSKNILLKNLIISFGGEHTAQIKNNVNVTFDQVQFYCSEYGITTGENKNLVFKNCMINSGLPPWYFRSDRKAEYWYKTGGQIIKNNVGKQTISSLLTGNSSDTGTEIFNCEFVNGHDLYLAGNVSFHHNLVNNLNDDGIFFKEGSGNTAKVFRNVFTKCLSCFSFAGEAAPLGGPWYIYRNLVDLRLPTASFRPLHPAATPGDNYSGVWRFGWLRKSGGISGSEHFFHNTALVINEKSQHASFTHLESIGSSLHGRSNINNIFIGINHNPEISKPVMKFPAPIYPDITDGNLYFRIGLNNFKMFEYARYIYPEGATTEEAIRPRKLFDFFDDEYKHCPLYIDSKDHYPPGYENNGIQSSPKFRHISNDGQPSPTDDFRLKPDSPAKKTGIILPNELRVLDTPLMTLNNPDIGCFALNAAPLKVGINLRFSYPGAGF